MFIDAIEVYCVRHPLIIPWRTAYGEDREILSVLTRIHSGSYSAWSETSPLAFPTYSPEFAMGVYYLVSKVFAPLVVGTQVDSSEQFETLFKQFKGNPFAKSALEIAWWTLEAELQGVPLHKLFNGSDAEVSVGADFGVQDTLDELICKVGTAVDADFPRVKLKVKPGWDLNVVSEVRRVFPNLTMHIDCNSGYSLDDLPLFKQMDAYGLAMIEQPLFHADIRDHAILQSSIDTPICLDESCNSPRAAREAVEMKACRYINIKPGRVGGILNSLLIHDMCKDAGIGCWIGGMLESAVGVGMLIELATLDNIRYPNDLIPSSYFFKQELTESEIVLSRPGFMKPSSLPGTGYKPVPERLKERMVLHEIIEK